MPLLSSSGGKSTQGRIRGVLQCISEKEFQEELTSQGIMVVSVVQIEKKRPNPLYMVLVSSEKSNEGKKKMFDLSKVPGLSVRVESKKRSTLSAQCCNCQEYWQVQFRGSASPIFAFCAGDHRSKDCFWPEQGLSAICALCAGNLSK